MWTRKADFPGLAEHIFTGLCIGSKGYIAFGEGTTNEWVQDFWEYDPATNAWTQKAMVPTQGRAGGIAFAIGTKGYFGTGGWLDGFGSYYLNDLWEYDQNTNVWTYMESFDGGARGGAIGFSIGTKGYVGLGGWNHGYFSDLWSWNQTSGVWTQLADFPAANFSGGHRTVGVGFSIGTKGYLGMGSGYDTITHNDTLFHDFWEYDPLQNSWVRKADLPAGVRVTPVGFSIGNKGYIGMGSGNPNIIYNDFWEWDQATDTWTQKINYGGNDTCVTTCFSIGNKGYVAQGWDRNHVKEFWEYDPDAWAGINETTNPIKTTFSPNPFTAQTTITIAGNTSNASLHIFNIHGQKVKTIAVGNKREIVLNREGMPQGVYFYEVKNSDNLVLSSGKMVVE